MLGRVKAGGRIVALDRRGQNWSTEQFARYLDDWQLNHKNIYLLVGGPDGLPGECLMAADDIWSLSALTLPHFLVRLLLVEQIYRAWSVLHQHPYHK